MPGAVIDVLRRFLPAYLAAHPALDEARRRAVWAITHCRTPDMGGHLHVCDSCGTREFHYHSCNHRSCPQCGGQDTADWVERELGKRVGAPYFMVTFTLPAQLREPFHTPAAAEMYRLFFAAASGALADVLANSEWLGAVHSGFLLVLHTWNQRLHFHPHLHAIVPGAGVDAKGRVVTVANPAFLVPQKALRTVFRARVRDLLAQAADAQALPPVDPAVWTTDWGVHLQPFGGGENAIRYLGAYVCRTAIGDSRIVAVDGDQVTFRWKDRAHGGLARTETLSGMEFVARYLRHVLPRGLRSIRHYGFCAPAAKTRRERIAFHTGRPLLLGGSQALLPQPVRACSCARCGNPMRKALRLIPAWKSARGPPEAMSVPA